MSEPIRSAGAVTYVAVFVVFAFLAGLGTWQMQRKAWKDALLASIVERQKLPPFTLFQPGTLGCRPFDGLEDPCDFRPIRLTGRMADAPAVHIFISIPRQANGLQGNGYWVFRQFEPAGLGMRVWVNAGFVPADKKDLSEPISNAETSIEGVLRHAEPRSRFSGVNDLKNNVYFVRDPSEFPLPSCSMVRCTNVDFSYYIDMTGPVPASGLPYPMAGKQVIPNRHLEYALTWYGLAVTWLIIAGIAIRPRRPPPAS